MKIQRIPGNTLTAAVALLTPYAPELSASTLVDALQHYDNAKGKPRYLNKHEAAARLGVSWFSLLRWAKAGKIEGAVKIGTQWRFDEDKLTVQP